MVELIDPAQCVLVGDCLVDCDEEWEGRGQLDPPAQFLMPPVQAAQLLSQVPSAGSLQAVLQHLGLIGLVPCPLIPVDKDGPLLGQSESVLWQQQSVQSENIQTCNK